MINNKSRNHNPTNSHCSFITMPPIRISPKEKGSFNIILHTCFTASILNRIIGTK